MIFKRVVAILVYYIGAPISCGVIAMGVGFNESPIWQALVMPVIFGACMLVINAPEFILPRKIAALGVGGVGLVLSIAGYWYGQILGNQGFSPAGL